MAVICSDNWEINNIEAVLFDKDGTFVDSDTYWGKLGQMRVDEVLKTFNLPDVFFEPLAIAIGLNPVSKKLIPNGPLAVLSRDEVIQILTDELINNNNINTDTVEISKIFENVHKEFMKDMFKYTFLLDGAETLFERLCANNIKMAVVTSDSYSHTVETLKYLKVDKYFDAVVGCDSLSLPKRTGAPALFALEKLKILPKASIVIGDAQMDAQMAKNGGLAATILTTTGQVPENELKLYSKYIVNNLAEIRVLK